MQERGYMHGFYPGLLLNCIVGEFSLRARINIKVELLFLLFLCFKIMLYGMFCKSASYIKACKKFAKKCFEHLVVM